MIRSLVPSAPLRVCFLIDELARAGTESQLIELIRRLHRAKVQPYLCLLRGENELSRTIRLQECPVWRLGVGSLKSPRTWSKLRAFRRYLRDERIDVLQLYFPDSTYFGALAGWLGGVPNVIRTRNNLGHWLTPGHRFLGRMINPLLSLNLTNCESARQALIRSEKAKPERVLVLENGVDQQRFDSIPELSGEPTRLGVVANLRPVKGLDVLIEALALVSRSHPEITLRVAGEGPERAALTEQSRRAGLGDRVELLGSVGDIPGFLSGIHVAVQPSRAEGMSNALLEQMAAGRIIVASDVGGNPELIEHGEHGLLVPPGDPTALASALEHVLDHPADARAMALAARRHARERFSRQAMVQRFEQFYLSLPRRRTA